MDLVQEYQKKLKMQIETEKERIVRETDTMADINKRDARVALIGYTNVGKSALLNTLSG